MINRVKKSTSRHATLPSLGTAELISIQGGTLPTSEANRFGYSINQAPNGATTGSVTYDRNFGNGFHGGADLTRQGGRTFGGVHFGGQMGSHGSWEAQVSRIGNDTNIFVKGGFKF